MPKVDLAGRTIAITGASSGIGRATAVACARAGMRVVCAARRADRLEQVVQEIRTGGGQAESLVMDVALPGENARLISFCLERFGSLFSVFSNAGYGIERSVLDYSQAELTAIFQTNFWSSLELMRLAARHMLEANPPPVRGHVLACSSCVSKIGLPNFAAYSGTKALQDHFGRAMRAELSSRGVLVSTVHPIGTRTEFFDTASSLSGAERTSIQTPDRLKQHPDVVARAIVGRLRRSVGGEVWTSLPIRLALAGAIIAPGLIDALLRKRQREMDSAR
ncbi:MAG: SDR family oxidoreductase [Phycisphaerales bacterium]|nr:SDR family oxidoreductase [Planctomycetota bacterium]